MSLDKTRINKKRVAKLVAALRSGKYEQAKGELRNGDCFCCLGVACDLSGLSQWRGGRYSGSDTQLPAQVAVWYGLYEDGKPCRNPPIAPRAPGENSRATYRNDHANESFSKIADRFEALIS